MYNPGETKVTASLQARLEQHVVDKDDRAAKRLLEVEDTAKVVANLEARLEASEERADNAEAMADALKTEARLNSNRLQHSVARAEKRFQEIQATYTTSAGRRARCTLRGNVLRPSDCARILSRYACASSSTRLALW